MLRLLALSLALVGTSATAQVYRCKLPSGQMSYSNQPCADQNAGGLVSERRTQEDLMQERERADEAQFRKEMRRAMQEQQTVPTQPRRVASSGPAVNQWVCRKARDNYHTTAGGIFRNAKERANALHSEQQKVDKACGTTDSLRTDPALYPGAAAPTKQPPAPVAQSEPQRITGRSAIDRCINGRCEDEFGNTYRQDHGTPGAYSGPNGENCRMVAGRGMVCR